MRRRTFWLLYLTILALAAVIRLYRLGAIPLGVYWDEIAILADAKKVAFTGADLHGLSPWHLIYPSYGDYKLAPYIWAATLSVKVLGVSYWALRLPSSLAGILTVIIAGALARLLAPTANSAKARLAQLATMLVVAITPWSVLFSRTGFEGHLGQMLLGAAALLLIYSWEKIPKKQDKKAVLINFCLLMSAGVLGGLASWTYYSVRFVWPVVALLVSVYFVLKTANWRFLLVSGGVIGVTFALALVAMSRDPLFAVSNQLRLGTSSLLNDPQLPHAVNYQRQLAGNNLLSRLAFSQKLTQVQGLAANYARHLDFAYLFLTGDANLRHSTGFTGLFYLCLAPFLLIGLIVWWRRDWRGLCLLGGWWLIGLLPASVPTTGVPHALRTLNSLIPACIIIGYGLSIWIQYILNAKYQSKYSKLYKNCLLAGTAIIIGLSGWRFAWYYLHVYPTLSAPDWQATNPRLAAILHQEKSNYEALYALDLDQFLYLWYLAADAYDIRQLGASDGYRFPELDNVYFGQAPSEAVDSAFLLTTAAALERYLESHPVAYSVIYDEVLYGQRYLGVSLEATPEAQ